ncbi:hypothetical protein MF406_13925 [Georgenia sp. TF02-10]|uniref:hypothetical protein n=1 Tax=Georgenia sp. TF02-10 TaxID=2917725 RepID=UPI001FA6C0CD|nr:hypothetical protein [Georgenia sp. TF02-10]UNX54034.1 hypothetical protein MF406_13925 [Georgenia sp. TF02-10]
MSAESARQALQEALDAGPDTLDNHVLRGAALGEAEVTRFGLVGNMAADVVADVTHAAETMARKQFLAYDPSYQTSTSQVLVEALADIPELAAIDALIRQGDVPDDNGTEPVVAMAHSIGTGDGQIVAYRLKGAGIATRRARGIPLVPRDGVYVPLTGEVIYYEPRFEALTVSGFVFFNTVTLVQTKLRAPAKARQLAKTTLKSVTTHIRIDGYAELEAAVMADPSMRAKMAHVARLISDDPEYARHLTTKKLVTFVGEHPEYDIATSKVDGEKGLKFDSAPQHRHKIPRLLADDYLHSYLTDRSYEAGSKQDVSS